MWTRILPALAQATGSVLRSFLRIARQLVHEVTGALFVMFAVAGGTTAWRTWRKGESHWLVGLTIGFSLMMTAFAVASFRSARRVR